MFLYKNICSIVDHLKIKTDWLLNNEMLMMGWFMLSYTDHDMSGFLMIYSLAVQLALYVLSFLEPRDLLRAAQTCRSWRFLSEDNLLWRVKCREASVEMDSQISKRLRRCPPTNSHPPSPWKVSSNVCTKYSKVDLFTLS